MNNVRQKLSDYSQTPPLSVWEGIVQALEEAPAYAQKLQAFETAPPPAAWEAIQKGLAAQPQATVVPLRTKLFKYAIAAAVLGVIAAGSIFYLKNSTAPGSTHSTTAANPSKNALLDEQHQAEPTASQHLNTLSADGTEVPPVSSRSVVHFSSQVGFAKKSVAATAPAITPEEKNIVDTELSDRYMIATTSTGRVVRLPKKAYRDYACAESYKNWWCKQRIASIQSKMAASVSTDFTEFMDLLKKLQEVQ